MQAGQLVLGHLKVFGQALFARGLGTRGAERADIKGLRLERLQEGHIVQLGVVGQGDDGGVGVGQHLAHYIVGHAHEALHAHHVQPGAVFLARVADQHFKVQHARHLRHRLGQLPGTDQQQTPFGTEHGAQNRAVVSQRLAALGAGQRHHAAAHAQAARDQLMARGAV